MFDTPGETIAQVRINPQFRQIIEELSMVLSLLHADARPLSSVASRMKSVNNRDTKQLIAKNLTCFSSDFICNL